MHKPSSSRRRCNRYHQTWMFLALPTVVALSAILSSFPTTTATITATAVDDAKSSNSNRESNIRGYRQHPSILLQQHHQRSRRAEKEETNDDGNTIIPLHPFSLLLSNLPSTSPILAMAATNTNTANTNNNNKNNGNGDKLSFTTYSTMDNAMNSLLQYITEVGAQTYTESGMYTERFLEWNVGTVWSVGSSEHSPRGGPPSAEGRNSENSNVVQPSPTAAASTTILTLGYNGTITLKGIYWDDPEPQELTEYLVRDLNGDATIQLGLLDRLRPLVCDAGDLIGDTCHVGFELVVSSSSSDVVPVVGESVEVDDEGDGVQDVAAVEKEVSDPQPQPQPPVDGVDNSEIVTDNNPPVDEAQYWAVGEGTSEPIKVDTTTIPSPDFIDTSTNTLVASTPSDSQYPTLASARGSTNNDDINNANTQSKMQMILPIILASIASLSILVAGLLYRRRRKRLRDAAALAPQDELVLNTTDDETLPEDHEHAIVHPPSSSWANNAYDAITSPRKSKNLHSYSYSNDTTSTKNRGGGDSSTSAATAGNSVAAASPTAAAAGAFPAPPPSKNNKATTTTTTTTTTNTSSQRKTLDDVIDSFSDGDSSFVSDSSASNSNTGEYNNGSSGANHGSVFGGLTGILGDSPTSSPTPVEDREFNDRILAAKRKLVQKDGANANNSSRRSSNNSNDSNGTSPRSVQKQEDFEGTYRTRSAMAKLNLKKDMLHVACDTHDAPENDIGSSRSSSSALALIGSGSGGKTSATRGGDSTVDYDVECDPEQQNLGISYGVTHTISPRKSTRMMEKQRNAEKLSLMARSRYFSSGGKSSTSRGPPSNKQNYGNVQKEQNRKEKVENDGETSKDLILPVGFMRSDSVNLVSKSSSDVSSEDAIGGVYD